MFRKRPESESDKAADRKDIETVKQRLSVVERRVSMLTYQLNVMRRDSTTEGEA